MNVASLDLCKELYELSGWKENRDKYASAGHFMYGPFRGDLRGKEVPAYSLGYLLRELPAFAGRNDRFSFQLYKWEHEYQAGYFPYEDGDLSHLYFEKADSPEDAACKLAIELFKSGVLK